MEIKNFLPNECTKVTLKDNVAFVDTASFRSLGILVFYPTDTPSTQRNYHKRLIFAWHNLGYSFEELANLLINVLNEYQNGILKGTLDVTPQEIFDSGINFIYIWICCFVHSDFIGPENQNNRQDTADLLRKLCEINNVDYDSIDPDEEEEEEEDFAPRKRPQPIMDQYLDDEPLLCELNPSLGEIKVYLRNLNQNLPVSEMPILIQQPEFDNETVKYDNSQPFPLRADCDVISEHFYYTGLKIFSQIAYSEYANCSWMKDDKDKNSPHILELESHFETTAAIVTDSILTTEDLSLRIKVIERWIDIIEAAINGQNFLLAFEIENALSRPSLAKLNATWRDVNRKSMHKFEKLKEITSTFKRYSKYKELLKSSNVRQTLPFINPWLTEMWLIESGNPKMKKLPNGDDGINFAKQWTYFSVVQFLKQPWGVDTAFLLNENLLSCIENYIPVIADDESMMKTSQFVERSAILTPVSPITPKTPSLAYLQKH